MSKDNVIDLKKPEPFTDDPEQSHVAIMLGFGTRVGGPGRQACATSAMSIRETISAAQGIRPALSAQRVCLAARSAL
jgi:hypothetical protein